MRNRWLVPLILLLGGMATVFFLLSLSRTDPAIKAGATNEDPYLLKMKLGLTYMQNGPPMNGIRLLQKLYQENPHRYEVPQQMGTMAMGTGQYAKAAGWFGRAAGVSTGPVKVNALLNWADALVMADKKDSARIILNQVSNYSNDSLLLRSLNEKLKTLK